MREILFKGFHKDKNGTKKIFLNNKWIKGFWVYGSLIYIPVNNFYSIVEQTSETKIYTIFHETTSQYTEIESGNGRKIFENDILKRCNDISSFPEQLTVVFNNCYTAFEGEFDEYQSMTLNEYLVKNYIVIGNIFENPEILLKK